MLRLEETQLPNLYETDTLKSVTGPAIRPGGLDLTDRALSHCRLTPGAAVLDAGCGRGATLAHLKGHHHLKAIGLDLSQLLLAEGRRNHPALPLVRADAARMPLPEASFAAVCCECVLSLAPQPQRVLNEFYRVLVPGGFLLLSDLYRPAPSSVDRAVAYSINCCLKGATTQDLIMDRVTAAGFKVSVWEDHSHLLKVLAAQLVFAYGSLDAFWSAIGKGKGSTGMTNDCRQQGYFLLVARKES